MGVGNRLIRVTNQKRQVGGVVTQRIAKLIDKFHLKLNTVSALKLIHKYGLFVTCSHRE